jgi:hypothetical protein
MPLQKLQFRPGVNREGTTLANEGGWFESDKVRFRSGYPEKIGGWVKDTGTEYPTSPTGTFVGSSTSTALLPPTGSFWGVCRALFNWLTLSGFNLLGVGTNLKYYIQDSNGGNFYDVTPVRQTSVIASNAFTTTYPANATLVTCNVPAHGAQVGDFVTISGVAGPVNGIPAASLNKELRVFSVPSSGTFTVVVDSGATSAGTTGAATFNFQINTGSDTYTTASGWGAGGWGGATTGFPSTGWGLSAATGVGVNLRLWSQSNFGENLIFNARGGAMNFWAVNPSPTVYDRGQVIVAGGTITQKNYNSGSGTTTVSIDATCPSNVNYVLVSDATRFTIAFGCNPINNAGTGIQSTIDPLLIRWSDQESYATWTPAITNQAGDYRLSQGSVIITAIQTRQEILVWTDTAVYSMQFVGAPYVWSFQIMGANLSIIGPNSAVTVNNITYWMGTDKFYMYSGRVETLPCSLRQYIFDDINLQQGFQVFGGSNEGYNEIWWYYCSAKSTVVDKYVIYNHLERTWAYGTLGRTAWLDSPLRSSPMATTYNNALVYHEQGNDDGTTSPASPIYAYVRSSDFDIGDGHNFGFVWRIIPDVTFDGSNVNQPKVNFTVFPRQNPGADYGSTDSPVTTSAQNYIGQRTYNVQQFTEYAYVRIRGRQMAFQISSADLGVSWQLGSPRLDVRSDGRR